MASDFSLKLGGDFKELFAGLKKLTSGFKSVGTEASQALQAPQRSLQTLGSQLQGFGSLAKGVVAGLAGVAGFKSLTKDFMDYHTNLANAVQLQGYNVTKLEALGGAMRRFGGDTSGAISSLDNLTSSLQQARWGQGALIDVVQRYGISVKNADGSLMNSEQLLYSLSKQLNRFDASTKQAIASQLGLDSALLRVIDTGNFDSLVAQQMKLNKTTQKDLDTATAFESAWLDMKDSFGAVAKQVSLILLPPLTKLMKLVTDGLQKFKNYKDGQLVGWVAIGGVILGVFSKLSSLVGLFKTLISVGTSIRGITSIFTGLGTAISSIFSPFGLIVGLFLALFLIADDLMAYFNGEESIFGDLAKKFPLVQSFLDGLGTAIDKIKSGISQFIDFLSNPSWDKFKEMVFNLIEEIKGWFVALGEFIAGILAEPVKKVGALIGGGISKLTEGAKGLWDKGLETLGFGGKKEEPTITNAPLTTLTPAGNNNVDNSTTTVNNNITQNIQGGDPKAIGTATVQATTLSLEKAKVANVK